MNRELHAASATWGQHVVNLPIWDVSRRRDHKLRYVWAEFYRGLGWNMIRPLFWADPS